MNKVKTPLFPTYAKAGAVMKAATGVNPKSVRDLITVIHDQTGTPQNPVVWSDPDTWIAERLEGDHAQLIPEQAWRTQKQGGVKALVRAGHG